MKTVHWLFVISAILFICGISFIVLAARASRHVTPATGSVTTPATTPVATVKQIMIAIVEPAATADISGGTLDRTYTGPRTIAPAGMHWVRQISKTGDFEAVLTWAIGLSEKRAFKVTSAPSRLTIELG